jgi:hypothetical protein
MIIELGNKVIFFLDKKEYTIKKIYSEQIELKTENNSIVHVEHWFADIKSQDGIIIKRVSIDMLVII